MFTVGADQLNVAVPLLGCWAALTVTVALVLADPAVPVQLTVYVVLAVRAGVERDPLVPSAPDQPPEAVHDVALVDDQVSKAVPPLVIAVGLAVKETLGAAAATVTVTDWDADPPLPVQVSENWVVALRGTVACVPLAALAPVQPPEAAQLLALLALQARVVVTPLLTVVGVAVSVTDGVAEPTETVTDCDALPPAFWQVIV